jgi:Ca2+-binding RTX toxin-like protein
MSQNKSLAEKIADPIISNLKNSSLPRDENGNFIGGVSINNQPLDENNYLIGSNDNDTLEGRSDKNFDIITGLSGKDTLVGAENPNLFLLGKTEIVDVVPPPQELPGETGKEVFYDEAGNDDYALISKFDRDRDLINLAGAKSDYSLGSSPSGLPEGTGIFKGDELIAIVEGQNDLTLDSPYFEASLA